MTKSQFAETCTASTQTSFPFNLSAVVLGLVACTGVVGDYAELQRLDSYVALTHFPKGVDPTAVFSVFKPSFRRMKEGFRTLAGPAGAQQESSTTAGSAC